MCRSSIGLCLQIGGTVRGIPHAIFGDESGSSSNRWGLAVSLDGAIAAVGTLTSGYVRTYSLPSGAPLATFGFFKRLVKMCVLPSTGNLLVSEDEAFQVQEVRVFDSWFRCHLSKHYDIRFWLRFQETKCVIVIACGVIGVDVVVISRVDGTPLRYYFRAVLARYCV